LPWFVWWPTGMVGRSQVSEPKLQDKPFVIDKMTVWEAYRKVKANKGAAGVDEQSIEDFERDLKGNLYRIWNRMSSGPAAGESGGDPEGRRRRGANPGRASWPAAGETRIPGT
jgi:hypothetical protein